MTKSIPYMGRAALTVCAAAVVLGQVGTTSAHSLDIKDITDLRMERKKANSDGKLPLPGTPDLKRLDERLAEQGVADDAPILIRVFKAESEMEVWTGDEDGNYKLFATYPICYWSGTLGPKQKEGDKQAPEGFYTVTKELSLHEGTRWPKSLNIGYPNPFDKVNLRSGSHILIHGGCASIGCFAMTNAVSLEVFKLATDALDAGQPNIPVHVFPFRMTEANFAKYDYPLWNGFWRNLKEGHDLFERTHRPSRRRAASRATIRVRSTPVRKRHRSLPTSRPSTSASPSSRRSSRRRPRSRPRRLRSPALLLISEAPRLPP
jgi:murein L,D-transpeptidase YafK